MAQEHLVLDASREAQHPPQFMPLEGFSVRALKRAKVHSGHVGIYEYTCDKPQDTLVNRSFCYIDFALSSRFAGAKAQYLSHDSPKICTVGRVVFGAPNIPFRCKWGTGTQRSIFARFDDGFAGSAGLSGQSRVSGFDVNDPVIRDLLVRLAREITVPDFASSLMIEALWCQIQLQLLRFFRVPEPCTERCKGTLTATQRRTIEDWIDSAEGPFTISDLSSELGLSNRHLSRLFHASTGSTITRFAVERQVSKAKMMLSEGMSVKTVSWSCGFETASAFSTAFKKTVGVTPREFGRDARRSGVCKGH
jgi:AraC family transcriptional regulator